MNDRNFNLDPLWLIISNSKSNNHDKLKRVLSFFASVTPHQDGSFLRNDPLNLVGFWFPIDDATLENGCLWYIPGSHKLQVSRHFVRNPKQEGNDEPLMVFHGENPAFNDSDWVAAPVKKGRLARSRESPKLGSQGFLRGEPG